MTTLLIHGAAGRMGRRLVALALESDELSVVAAMEHAGHPRLGDDAGLLAGVEPLGVPLTETLPPSVTPDVAIDFSLPQGTRRVLPICRERGVPLVIGTTGLTADDHALIAAAAADVAVLQAPNMSLGVNLLFALCAQAARVMGERGGEGCDIEIVEAHHRYKRDAPSGTALGILEAICDALHLDPAAVRKDGRSGDDPRPEGTAQIAMHALRMGSEVGRHSAHFATLEEEITLSHRATTRDVFVKGALRAAAWLAHRPPGRYAMRDVLGLA